MPGRLCLLLLASPLHDRAYLEGLRWSFRSSLQSLGFRFEDEGVATSPAEAMASAHRCDGVVAVVATGGTEELIVSSASQGKPVLFVAVPYANSLPALLEAKPLLEGRRAAVAAVDSLDPSSLSVQLRAPLKALEAVASLQGARLGVVGRPSPWLVYSRVEPGRVRERVGVELVEVPMEQLYSETDRATVEEELVERVASRASRVEVDRRDIVEALKVYKALKSLAERYRLDAVTVECFRLISDRRTTSCLAFSLLNSEGFVAGCEADVPATLTMMLVSRVSGKPVFMGNPAAIREGELLLAHCTAPIAEGASYSLHTHFESGLGVGVSVAYPAGERVTLARLKPSLDLLRVVRGRVKASGLMSRLHCRTQVLVELVSGDAWRLLRESIGNHYVLVRGDYTAELGYAAMLLGASLDIL